MDEKAKKIMDQVQSNPAKLQSVMQSNDGRQLLQMLTSGDQGATLSQAVKSATMGDTSQIMQMVNQLMNSPEGSELVDRINKTMQK